MLRHLFIASLSTVAITMLLLEGIGFTSPTLIPISLSSRARGYVCFSDGLIRAYLYRCNTPFYMKPSSNRRQVVLHRFDNGSVRMRITHASARQISPYALVSSRWPPPRGQAGSVVHLVGLRTKTRLAVALLLIYPVIALVGDRRRARRRKVGYCNHCGYDLTGNITGVCPECGQTYRCEQCDHDLTGNRTETCPACGHALNPKTPPRNRHD